MELFRRLFFTAALAGLAAGVLVSVVQEIGTTPLILEAETYESAGAAAGDATAETTATDDREAAGDEEWAPADGIQRSGLTLVANIVTGIGFALLLVAAFALRGGEMNWRKGLNWGLAGFAIFTLAPGLGLPPDLPGTQAAELLDRQIWWVATAVATAAGLGLIFFGKHVIAALAGIVLIVLPHVYGAPHPAEFGALAPVSLEKQYVVAVVVTSLLFWAALGSLSGHLYRRFGRAA